MKRLVFLAAAAAVVLFPTTSSAARSQTGTVVATGHGSIAVAGKGGVITTVQTRLHARVGERVRISGRSVRVIGFTHRIHLQAVIVRRAGSTTFLAGGHSLFSVHTRGHALASVVVTQPKTGSVVNTTATVGSNGQLIAGSTQVVGQMSTIQVQATITGVNAGSITLSVSGQPLTLSLPAGIQLPQSLVGSTVTLTLNLTGTQPTATEDNDDQGDNNDDQGDNNDDQGDNGGDTSGGGGGDNGD